MYGEYTEFLKNHDSVNPIIYTCHIYTRPFLYPLTPFPLATLTYPIPWAGEIVGPQRAGYLDHTTDWYTGAVITEMMVSTSRPVLHHPQVWHHGGATVHDSGKGFIMDCHQFQYTDYFFMVTFKNHIINSLSAKFFRGNINMYLHFMLFLYTDKTMIIEILPRIRPGLTYFT